MNGVLMRLSQSVHRVSDEFLLRRDRRLASDDGLTLYSMGKHAEKVGVRARRMGDEELAVEMFRLSSERFEEDAREWAVFGYRNDSDLRKDQLKTYVSFSLRRAAGASDLAGDSARAAAIRGVTSAVSKLKLQNTPFMLNEALESIARV
jgi:hypothetical protein